MIWDFIRDFFVMYIFGGTASDFEMYDGFFGTFLNKDDFVYSHNFTSDTFVPIGDFFVNGDFEGSAQYISIGDWLSTTATIICMCLIVFLLICLVRWIFRAVSSAMLLK